MMTMDKLKQMIVEQGYRVLHSSCWENENWMYAFSIESHGLSCYGHPKCTASYNKSTGWLSVTGRQSVNIGVVS